MSRYCIALREKREYSEESITAWEAEWRRMYPNNVCWEYDVELGVMHLQKFKPKKERGGKGDRFSNNKKAYNPSPGVWY